MDIGQIIHDIQSEHCVSCLVGKCVLTLKSLQDEQEKPSDKDKAEPAIPKAQRAKKAAQKPQKPASNPDMGKVNKREAILEYLKKHPNSGSVDIAKGLGISRAATNWNLSDMRRSGLVEMVGKSAHARWLPAGKQTRQPEEAPTAPTAPPPMALETSKPFGCEICGKRFYVRGSLIEHMRMRHPKGETE